ncbi:RDD family protein [Halobacteriovorax sp. HLS]|uniref:RDD family protein n=1 Tax=Halobacteriovorax sp. HLS TaxID=2234000 RepID=UPI000FD9E4B3|nr:RDD family protein [Halobacteriovorax sp. HLS]
MDNQITHNEPKSNDSNIVFNTSEFNLDEFDFKPLNEGLGFHQEERRNGILPTNNNKNISVSRSHSAVRTSSLGISNPKVADKGIQSMNALSAFYEETQPEQVEVELKKTLTEESFYQVTSSSRQFGAWLVDISVVTLMSISLLGLFVLVSGLKVSQFYQIIGPNDLLIFGASAFSIFYLSYFSILDLQTTPGKSMFKIKLVKENNQPVSLKDSFLRSFITVISFVTLGLPCIIDFQGKLTDTKVVDDV